MKSKSGVYQSEEYKKALKIARAKLVEFSGKYAVSKDMRFLKLKKTILEARGNLNKKELEEFKSLSKKYFYGTIAPSPINADYSVLDKEYTRFDNSTILIDLTKSEEDLWQALEKKSARWGVKTAQKNGLKILDQLSNQELDEFYSLYLETSQGQFTPEKKDFIREVALSDIGKLFIVKSNDSIVAGGLILIDRELDYAILDLTTASEKGLDLQAMPFLYWHMILFAKKAKLSHFDLGGYDKKASKNSKIYGINKFKERFGGQVVSQPIYCTNSRYIKLRNLAETFKFIKGAYKKE